VEITSAVAVKRAAAVGEQKAKLGHAARGDWALGVQPQRDVVDDVLRGNDVNGIDLGTHRPES
jgi:hypothetical protein